MGTTAQKLTYLNETKSQLKDTINYSGASITNDTFRQYPRKLYAQYLDILKNPDTLFNGMPKVPEQTGTELTLNDTANTRMKLKLNPSELTQETTKGKNLIQITTSNGISSGVTRTINKDKTITLNGTATANMFLKIGDAKIEADVNYYLSGCPTGGGASTYRLYTAGGIASAYDDGSGARILGQESGTIPIYIVVYNGVTVNNLTFKPQLEPGNSKTNYEPYTGGIPQPNPEFPSEVQVIKGNNSIKIENKNLAWTGWAEDFVSRIPQSDWATITTYDGRNALKIYCATGYQNYDTQYIFKTNFKENTQYTFQFDYLGTKNDYMLSITYTDGTSSSFSRVTANVWTHYVLTSTANKTIKYLKTVYTDGWGYIDLDTFMVYEGTETISYVTHQEQILPLNLPNGMEYCKIGDYEDEFEHDGDKWYLNKYIGKVVLDGSENWQIWSIVTSEPLAGFLLDNYVDYNNSSGTDIRGKANYFKVGANAITNEQAIGLRQVGDDLKRLYVSINNTIVNDLATFKTWLSTHNTTLYYVLSTPTHEEITDTTLISQLNAIEKALSYDGQTNISQTNTGLPFRIKASAVRSLANIFDMINE